MTAKSSPALIGMLLLCAAMDAAAFIGCSGKKPSPGAEDSSGGTSRHKVLISVLAGQSTSDAGIEEMINDLLEREVPGVELDWERVDWGDKFQSQMRADFSAGEVPDIMIGKAQDVATYAHSGNLAPIPEAILRHVDANYLRTLTFDGLTFGVPYNALYQGVFYNKDIFATYGLRPPRTRDELKAVVARLKAAGVTPFASHFEESWYVGNIAMQFAIGDVFGPVPDWGDRFRAGKTSFARSEAFQNCFLAIRSLRENSWPDALGIDQNECDERFANGKAAMYVSGSWSLQTFAAVNSRMSVGIFPYPDYRGDAKLIFEPNMTFMKSSKTSHAAEVDAILAAIFASKDLAAEILDFTRSSSMLKDIVPDERLPIQGDIDRCRAEGRVVDATGGNTQLIWSFQDAVALKLEDWLQGRISLAAVLDYADQCRALSGPK
jgi:ABC-type glycerol-3-phosphate transport system substrate-binding protein